PLLVIAIGVAGLVFGRESAEGAIVQTFRDLVGDRGGDAIEAMVEGSSDPGSGAIATVLGIVTLLFGASGVFGQLQESLNAIFKVLPAVRIRWSDVWIGAVVTGVLFELGKLGIGIYLGKAGVGSAYGAAGSFVVLLIWVYYSSQIMFFGAEFTRAYARKYGSH